MDAELKAYLDGMVETITSRIDARFTRVEERLDGVEERLDGLEGEVRGLRAEFTAMRTEFGERFIGIDERFGSMELRVEQFEVRVTGRLDSLDEQAKQLVVRTGAVEQHMLNLNTRVDVLADDMRQRFRVLNDRLAGAA